MEACTLLKRPIIMEIFGGDLFLVTESNPGEFQKNNAGGANIDIAYFSSMDDLENYLADQGITPIGHIASEESLF